MKQVQDVKIFCSYAHEDQLFAYHLKTHFAPLVRLNSWVFCTDMEIRAGEEWEPTVQGYLDTAQIILLLVSPDFMASDYCYSKEMKRAMERHEQKEAYVIPIIIRPVAHWKDTPLGKLQALPADGKPITDRDWQTADHAFTHVVEKISHTIGMLTGENKSNTTKSAPTRGIASGIWTDALATASIAPRTSLVAAPSAERVAVYNRVYTRYLEGING